MSAAILRTAKAFGRRDIARVPCHRHSFVRSSRNLPNAISFAACMGIRYAECRLLWMTSPPSQLQLILVLQVLLEHRTDWPAATKTSRQRDHYVMTPYKRSVSLAPCSRICDANALAANRKKLEWPDAMRIRALILFVLFSALGTFPAMAQNHFSFVSDFVRAGRPAPTECVKEGEHFMKLLSAYPHPASGWDFVVVCDDTTWQHVMRKAGMQMIPRRILRRNGHRAQSNTDPWRQTDSRGYGCHSGAHRRSRTGAHHAPQHR